MRRDFGFTGFGIGNPRPASPRVEADETLGPELVTAGDTMEEGPWDYSFGNAAAGGTQADVLADGDLVSQTIALTLGAHEVRFLVSSPGNGDGDFFIRFEGSPDVESSAISDNTVAEQVFELTADATHTAVTVRINGATGTSGFRLTSVRKKL